ncbi:MAG: relaxase domain-containing protein, partial [Rickettsiales bacterium]|nr:relaxase domain-containing protein [Rickettsiales bacterium]
MAVMRVLTVAHAEGYFADDLKQLQLVDKVVAQKNKGGLEYYEQEAGGEWYGNTAKVFGLSGKPLNEKDYSAIVHGKFYVDKDNRFITNAIYGNKIYEFRDIFNVKNKQENSLTHKVEGKYINEIDNKIAELLKQEPVAETKNNEFVGKNINELKQEVFNYYDKYSKIDGVRNDGVVFKKIVFEHKELGEVELSKTGIKNSIQHSEIDNNKILIDKNIAIAFKHLDKIINNGIIISKEQNWKDRGYNTYLMGTNINIDGKEYIVETIVKETCKGLPVNNRHPNYLDRKGLKANDQRPSYDHVATSIDKINDKVKKEFYLHNVIEKEKLKELSTNLPNNLSYTSDLPKSNIAIFTRSINNFKKEKEKEYRSAIRAEGSKKIDLAKHVRIQADLTNEQKKDGIYKRKDGIELTLSAPKSVSIAGLVYGDKRVIDAHMNAIHNTLDYIQENLLFVRTKGEYEKIDNMIATNYNHCCSREKDPDIHTHCLIHNIGIDKNNKIKAVDFTEALNNESLIRQMYYHELTTNLTKIGYTIEQEKKIKQYAPEIKGISKDIRDEFSMARMRLETEAERLGIHFDNTEAMNKLWNKLRPKKDKNITKEQLIERWEEQAKRIGMDIGKGIGHLVREENENTNGNKSDSIIKEVYRLSRVETGNPTVAHSITEISSHMKDSINEFKSQFSNIEVIWGDKKVLITGNGIASSFNHGAISKEKLQALTILPQLISNSKELVLTDFDIQNIAKGRISTYSIMKAENNKEYLVNILLKPDTSRKADYNFYLHSVISMDKVRERLLGVNKPIITPEDKSNNANSNNVNNT